MFREVDVAISRTRGANPDQKPIREIEALFVDQIGRAKRFIYAENQYFASRKIGRAILERLAENDGPEIVIVNPKSAQGWLDGTAMSPARARLLRVERPGCHLSDPRDLPSAGRQGQRPATLAEFECEEEHLAIGRGNFWGARGGR